MRGLLLSHPPMGRFSGGLNPPKFFPNPLNPTRMSLQPLAHIGLPFHTPTKLSRTEYCMTCIPPKMFPSLLWKKWKSALTFPPLFQKYWRVIHIYSRSLTLARWCNVCFPDIWQNLPILYYTNSNFICTTFKTNCYCHVLALQTFTQTKINKNPAEI